MYKYNSITGQFEPETTQELERHQLKELLNSDLSEHRHEVYVSVCGGMWIPKP